MVSPFLSGRNLGPELLTHDEGGTKTVMSGKQRSEIQNSGREVMVASVLRASGTCEKSLLGQQG